MKLTIDEAKERCHGCGHCRTGMCYHGVDILKMSKAVGIERIVHCPKQRRSSRRIRLLLEENQKLRLENIGLRLAGLAASAEAEPKPVYEPIKRQRPRRQELALW